MKNRPVVPLPKVKVKDDFPELVALVGRGEESAKSTSQHILEDMVQYLFANCSDHHCCIVADLYLRQIYPDQTQHEVFSDTSMAEAWKEAYQRTVTHRHVQELVGALMKGMMYFSQDDADVVAGAEKILKQLERGSLLIPFG